MPDFRAGKTDSNMVYLSTFGGGPGPGPGPKPPSPGPKPFDKGGRPGFLRRMGNAALGGLSGALNAKPGKRLSAAGKGAYKGFDKGMRFR